MFLFDRLLTLLQSDLTFSMSNSSIKMQHEKQPKSHALRRAVVYDPGTGSVDICKESKVDKGKKKPPLFMLLLTNFVKQKERYTEIDIYKKKQVFLYRDPLSMAIRSADEAHGDENFLARLKFNNLSWQNQALFRLGFMSTLYVDTKDVQEEHD